MTASLSEPFRRGTGGTFGRWIEGSLLIFTAVIEKRTAILDHLPEELPTGLLSEGRIVVEIADELASQRHMLSTCFWIVFGDRSDAAR